MIAPAGEALRDVVVGLAGQPQIDPEAGERPERLAGRALELQADRTVKLAALERAGQPRPEGAVGGRQPQAGGRHRALAAEGGGDRGLQR